MEETGGPLKAIKRLKNGTVILQSKDEDQNRRVKGVLKQGNTVTVREPNKKDPMIMVIGISKDIEKQELEEMIINQNKDLRK